MSRGRVGLTNLAPRKVCLIKPSALGDIVNGFGALSALRVLWPDARFAWVVNRSLRGLVDGHPDVDEVIPYDRGRAGAHPSGIVVMGGFLAGLRRHGFDLAIDLQGLFRSGLMCAATGAPIRVGLADAREGAPLFYTHRVAPPPADAHAVDRLLTIARAFGADTAQPKIVAAISDADRAWARTVVADVGRPRVVLNVGARWITKRWPPEHFAEIARRLVRDYGAGLVAVGAPEDRPLVDELIAQLPSARVVDVCGRTTLAQLAAIAAECDLFLSNDSGPLHLAAAAGTRVVGVYTCTSAGLNGPYGPLASAVESRVWCAASYRRTCPRLECFSELSPDRVWPAIVRQLDLARRGQNPAA